MCVKGRVEIGGRQVTQISKGLFIAASKPIFAKKIYIVQFYDLFLELHTFWCLSPYVHSLKFAVVSFDLFCILLFEHSGLKQVVEISIFFRNVKQVRKFLDHCTKSMYYAETSRNG